LKATSKFGEQMDSLADIVNFGAAPALVLYAYMLDRTGAIGWIAALMFAIACGLRLARFNVQLRGSEPAGMDVRLFYRRARAGRRGSAAAAGLSRLSRRRHNWRCFLSRGWLHRCDSHAARIDACRSIPERVSGPRCEET
jgi:phosphatidylglycerophosphate synthase